MKILWFTNTPSLASDMLKENKLSGGWLSSLEMELTSSQEVQLSISFYVDKKIEHFNRGSTSYYPIYRKSASSKIMRLVSRVRSINNTDRIEVKELLKIVETVQPDIIHVHGTEDNFGLIVKHTKIPVVISIQGVLGSIVEKFFSGIPRHVADIHEGVLIKIQMKSSSILYENMKRRALREREILKYTKFVMGRTDWDKRASRLLAPNSSYFIGNEIMRDSFYNGSWKKKTFNERVSIVTVLSPALYKGLETIIRTALLLSSDEHFKFEWVVVGLESKNGIISIIENWLKVNSRNVNVFFRGQKDESQILKVLLDSDIYCQVSHIENSSNSLCEAMLIGMPIVATFVGGTSSLLEDKKEGLLVQEGDPYSMAAALQDFAQNPSLAIEYGQRARERAFIRHNKVTVTTNLISTYSNLLLKAND